MTDVLDLYKQHYEFYKECFVDEHSKYEWVASEVFHLATYDGELDELFVTDILEVCDVILNGTNYDYIEDELNYRKYVLVCQLLNKKRWIDWGTSIRGAWFERYDSDNIVENVEWISFENNESERHTIPEVPFTKDNLKALITFIFGEELDVNPFKDVDLNGLKDMFKKE